MPTISEMGRSDPPIPVAFTWIDLQTVSSTVHQFTLMIGGRPFHHVGEGPEGLWIYRHDR